MNKEMSECQNAKLQKCKRLCDSRFFFPLTAFIVDNITKKKCLFYWCAVSLPPRSRTIPGSCCRRFCQAIARGQCVCVGYG